MGARIAEPWSPWLNGRPPRLNLGGFLLSGLPDLPDDQYQDYQCQDGLGRTIHRLTSFPSPTLGEEVPGGEVRITDNLNLQAGCDSSVDGLMIDCHERITLAPGSQRPCR